MSHHLSWILSHLELDLISLGQATFALKRPPWLQPSLSLQRFSSPQKQFPSNTCFTCLTLSSAQESSLFLRRVSSWQCAITSSACLPLLVIVRFLQALIKHLNLFPAANADLTRNAQVFVPFLLVLRVVQRAGSEPCFAQKGVTATSFSTIVNQQFIIAARQMVSSHPPLQHDLHIVRSSTPPYV